MAVKIRITNHSRLRFDQLLLIDGITFWDLEDMPDIPAQSDDLQYTVTSVDRMDSIAYQFYGDPTLWWVIATANCIDIHPSQLNVGAVLRIPSPRFVLQTLFQNPQPTVS